MMNKMRQWVPAGHRGGTIPESSLELKARMLQERFEGLHLKATSLKSGSGSSELPDCVGEQREVDEEEPKQVLSALGLI